MTMTITTQQILAAKRDAGDDAYLALFGTGGKSVDCILWASEEDSEGDNGARAINRWTLTAAEADALAASGEVDEQQ